MSWWIYLVQGGILALEAALGKSKYGSILGAIFPVLAPQPTPPSAPIQAADVKVEGK